MQIIETKVYEYDELSKEAQEKALEWIVGCELELMDENSPFYDAIEKAEKMRTPWFAGSYIYEMYNKDLEETLRANGYTFTEDGKRFG